MDWSAPREDRYEFIEVVDGQEVALLDGFIGGRIVENSLTELKSSASLNYVGGEREWNDRVLRVYYVAGTERVCLGTFVMSTPRMGLSRKGIQLQLEGYSTLVYAQADRISGTRSFETGDNVLQKARVYLYAAGLNVVCPEYSSTLTSPMTLDAGLSRLAIANGLLERIGYSSVDVDRWGNALMYPYLAPNERPVTWTFRDDESGIFLPDCTATRDTFDVPNVVIAVASGAESTMTATARNDDPSSPYSTVSRGREVTRVERVGEYPSQEDLQRYANRLLAEGMSGTETVEIQHAYAPIAMRDAVDFDYRGAGFTRRLVVVSRDMSLVNGCLTKTTMRWAW